MAKSTIVPGVHDLIPPQGRVTVQLTDPDRPWRVRKEVKAENAVMDWWLSGVDNGFRGAFDDDTAIQYQPHFNMSTAANDVLFTHSSWAAGKFGAIPGRWPGRYSNHGASFFWASDQNVTPDSSKPWIPTNDTTGEITAQATVDVTTAINTTFAKRGILVASESHATYDQCRMVLEWSTDVGNGTWRSAGIGNVTWKNNPAAANVVPQPLALYHTGLPVRTIASKGPNNGGITNWWSAGSNGVVRSASHPVAGEIWAISYNAQILEFDMVNWATSQTWTATGLGDGWYGIVKIPGGNLWVTKYGSNNLYEIDPDLSSFTIINTFDLTANLGGDNMYDITSDGTDLFILGDTDVHRVNTSGVWQSSFTHGVTLQGTGTCLPNLEYDPAMGHLWLASGDSTQNITLGSATFIWTGNSDSNDSTWEGDTPRVYAFSTAGTQLNYTWKCGYYGNDDPWFAAGHVTGIDPQGWCGWTPTRNRYAMTDSLGACPWAPPAISHALLPSDVVKTSSDALKVVYDFDFTS